MANHLVTVKRLKVEKNNIDADTVTTSLAYAIKTYLATVSDTKTIHSIDIEEIDKCFCGTSVLVVGIMRRIKEMDYETGTRYFVDIEVMAIVDTQLAGIEGMEPTVSKEPVQNKITETVTEPVGDRVNEDLLELVGRVKIAYNLWQNAFTVEKCMRDFTDYKLKSGGTIGSVFTKVHVEAVVEKLNFGGELQGGE